LAYFPSGNHAARCPADGFVERRLTTSVKRKETGTAKTSGSKSLNSFSRAERQHTEGGFAQPQRFGDFLEDEKEDDDADRQANEENPWRLASMPGT